MTIILRWLLDLLTRFLRTLDLPLLGALLALMVIGLAVLYLLWRVVGAIRRHNREGLRVEVEGRLYQAQVVMAAPLCLNPMPLILLPLCQPFKLTQMVNSRTRRSTQKRRIEETSMPIRPSQKAMVAMLTGQVIIPASRTIAGM